MKRMVMLLAVLVPMLAQAQIKIEKKTTPIVMAFTANFVGEAFEVDIQPTKSAAIYILAIQTNNRFDDRMLFPIGFSKQEALTSLRQIYDLLDEEIGSRYELPLLTGTASVKVAENGTALFPTKKNKVGLYVSGDGFAGAQVITRKILETLIEQTEEYEEPRSGVAETATPR